MLRVNWGDGPCRDRRGRGARADACGVGPPPRPGRRAPGARAGSARRDGAQLRPGLGQRPGRGPELDLALRARELWEQLGAEVPAAGFRPHGSLTLAASEAELALLKEAAARPDAAERGYELLDAAAAREVSPALRGSFAGALLCHRDAIVEPRLVPGAIRDYLLAAGAAAAPATTGGPAARRSRWRRTRSATTPATGTAATWSCCAPAPPTPASPGRTWPATSARRCAGSGSRCCRPSRSTGRLTTSVADGDSLRYYPAYDLPGRDRLPPQEPAGAAAAAQLLLVQRLDGSLTIGDTHEYDEPFAFDVDEAHYDHLRGRARAAARDPAAAYPAPVGRRLQPGHDDRAVPPLPGRAGRGPGDRPRRAGHDLLARDRRGDLRVSPSRAPRTPAEEEMDR